MDVENIEGLRVGGLLNCSLTSTQRAGIRKGVVGPLGRDFNPARPMGKFKCHGTGLCLPTDPPEKGVAQRSVRLYMLMLRRALYAAKGREWS